MNLNLDFKFLLTLLSEYAIIDNDQKEYLLKKVEHYHSLYRNVRKSEPFITDLLLFMFEKEKIQLEEEYLLKLIARRAGCDFVHLDPLKIDSQLVMSTISLPYGKSHIVLPFTAMREV